MVPWAKSKPKFLPMCSLVWANTCKEHLFGPPCWRHFSESAIQTFSYEALSWLAKNCPEYIYPVVTWPQGWSDGYFPSIPKKLWFLEVLCQLEMLLCAVQALSCLAQTRFVTFVCIPAFFHIVAANCSIFTWNLVLILAAVFQRLQMCVDVTFLDIYAKIHAWISKLLLSLISNCVLFNLSPCHR